MATTDVRPQRLAGLSVRNRITIAVAFLTGLALVLTGVLVYTLEAARIETEVTARTEQEIAEFRRLRNGNDPSTAQPFVSVEALVKVYLSRNVPDDDEVLAGYWDGRIQVSSLSPPHPQALELPEFLDVMERRLDDGGSERIHTEFGEIVVTVQPVRNSSTTGALVVGHFLSDEYAELNRIMQTYAVVAVLLLLLVTGTAAWQAGRLLSPLRTLRETARDISGTDLSRRIPEVGNDDITALTHTVNEMLARLDRAFTDQRQFLDDAGHEFKTPLTIVRGHMELLDACDPAEVEATRALLLDEVDRMSLLVNDLIMLAKTDRPDFVRPQPVQLGPFLHTVGEKCRALGHRTWVEDETSPVTACLDEQRITQALLQLAQNAVKHTCEGATIGLGARAGDDHAVQLWVRDTGPGVPDHDKARVFDRFVRGRDEVDDDGFGLGLSIVSAIARAHEGSVEVQDAPGGGAVFTLTLPLQPAAEPHLPTDDPMSSGTKRTT